VQKSIRNHFLRNRIVITERRISSYLLNQPINELNNQLTYRPIMQVNYDSWAKPKLAWNIQNHFSFSISRTTEQMRDYVFKIYNLSGDVMCHVNQENLFIPRIDKNKVFPSKFKNITPKKLERKSFKFLLSPSKGVTL
jgi:hypothetical protein